MTIHPSPTPLRCAVLAVDPAARSGWAVWASGKLVDHGTGLSVVPERSYSIYEAQVPVKFKDEAAREWKAKADGNLSALSKAAKEAGVPCDVVLETSDQPYDAIIDTADKKGCDLIMMASHGRRGVGALLIGSETQKVLTHSKIPVLVYR